MIKTNWNGFSQEDEIERETNKANDKEQFEEKKEIKKTKEVVA